MASSSTGRGRPHYLRSKRNMSFHATRSATFSGYTFFEVSFVEFPQRFQEFRLAGEYGRIGMGQYNHTGGRV